MGISVIPAPSAASKTMFRTTLTSGTSYTVPTGVTYLNVTLYGGGGGGSGGGNNANNGNTGGTTTFTGATSAAGGLGGTKGGRDDDTNGQSANANTGLGGQTAYYTENGSGQFIGGDGFMGDITRSTLSATAGATISYAIGAGGTGGSGTLITGGTGGSGKIEVEYWA
jgi:hypothetical protein